MKEYVGADGLGDLHEAAFRAENERQRRRRFLFDKLLFRKQPVGKGRLPERKQRRKTIAASCAAV